MTMEKIIISQFDLSELQLTWFRYTGGRSVNFRSLEGIRLLQRIPKMGRPCILVAKELAWVSIKDYSEMINSVEINRN